MKRLMIAAIALLPAINTHAGVCNAKTVTGAYAYEAASIVSGSAVYGAGRLGFDGAGKATLAGIAVTDGVSQAASGSGTYAVSSTCVVTVNLSVGTQIWIYLDKLDTVPAVNVAHHGKVVFNNSTHGYSGLGDFDRVTGKF
ncbi:MAG: hypothetical protein ABL933_15030 [Methyloglobulus sp.]|nr:hypothetical protein [Methyloglobulus sp.]